MDLTYLERSMFAHVCVVVIGVVVYRFNIHDIKGELLCCMLTAGILLLLIR